MLVFAVYDSKAKAYMRPFFSQSIGTAIRAFGDVVNDPQEMVAKHSADFSLHHIGEFDDVTGVLSALEHQVNLGLAASFKDQSQISLVKEGA